MTKELLILRGEIKTPPLSQEARREVGFLFGSYRNAGND